MPKIIEDVKDKILEKAKEQLFTVGYQKLTLRGIAKECNIAVGTIYNHFSSKDMLVASVLSDDWKHTMSKMKQGCDEASNLLNGFSSIYTAIREFANIYSGMWSESAFAGNVKYSFPKRHKLLRNQISQIVSELLAKFQQQEEEGISVFLAETLLTFSTGEDMDEKVLYTIINRLYPDGKDT